MSKKANWTIVPSLVKDMENVFDDAASLVATLRTNRGTWTKIVTRKGVKRATAATMVKCFFRVTREIAEGRSAEDGVFDHIARDVHAKYETQISDHDYEPFLEEI
jgi:hypothetical protein